MAAVMAVGAYAVVRTIADSQHRQIDALISDAVPDIARVVPPTGGTHGVLDSVAIAVQLELRYRGLRAPHKFKMGVSGCARECAEARGKDVA